MAQAVVLAAGLSSRAKMNKMTLQVQGVPILIRVIQVLQVHCSDIVVVTGHYKEDVMAMVAGIEGVRCVHNEDYGMGMFTSVQRGVGEMSEDFFLIPGDYPLLKVSSLDALLKSSGSIRVPAFNGKGGHPIFIEQSLIQDLLKEPPDSNLKIFRNRQKITWVPVEDSGVLADVDTIEDYEAINNRT